MRQFMTPNLKTILNKDSSLYRILEIKVQLLLTN